MLGRLDREQRFAVFHRPAVLHELRDDGTRDFGFDLVHQLHRFDDAEHLSRA